MQIFWDLFENGTIAKQYYERRCNERTTCTIQVPWQCIVRREKFFACVVSGQSQEKMYSAIVVRGEDF